MEIDLIFYGKSRIIKYRRARTMTASRSTNHPWKSMSDEELLRSAGLILKDEERQIEGITLAAILLFGKDATIMSVLPQHKTDAIFRIENLDRYDDGDVIITNLLETYERLMEFGQKQNSQFGIVFPARTLCINLHSVE